MKKIVLLFALLSQIIVAQTTETKVWNLLLQNKREDARKLFDKELKSQVNLKVEYLLLDNIIHHENGKIYYDESFVQDFSKFPESKYYLCSLFKEPFIVDNVQQLGFNDWTYKKIDDLSNMDIFKNDPTVIYYKATADRNRKRYDDYDVTIKKLNAIAGWQFCGPFENLNDSGMDTEYEPEYYPKNDKLFDGNSNGMLGWYNPSVSQNEGYISFSNEDEYGNGIIYSQVFLDNPKNQEIVFNFGMSASMKIFVNDVQVYVNSTNKGSDLNAFKLKLNIKKGCNRILIKSASDTNNSYFILRLTDSNDNQIEDLVYNSKYKEYIKSSIDELKPVEITPDYESFIVNKVKSNPNQVLYKILLFQAYMHNKKLELAYDVIEELEKNYPNSSLIKACLIKYYSSIGDKSKVNELIKNIELIDSNYYYAIALKAADSDWIKTTNLTELEKYRESAKKLESQIFYSLYDFLINARNSKLDEMVKTIDDILKNSNNSEFYTVKLSPLYETLEKNKAKTIKILEDLNEKKDNFSAMVKIISYYKDANRKEEIKKIFTDRLSHYSYFTGVATDYIGILIDDKNYPEALKEIDKALSLFPYSYQLLEKKGLVYNYMSNVKEAEKYFRQSLTHNSQNNSLRNQLYDITKTPDEIESIDVKDKYKIIKERRNSKLKSDYGVVTLLDEYIVNILPEGGRKSKVAFIYEITSENGVDKMKEYNLNTSYINLQKSEIVKLNNTIVPAEEGDGKLVFKDLQIGDVIYIEYDSNDNSNGRFYKEFNLNCYFNSIYPSVESLFAVICPSDKKYNSVIHNGDIIPTIKKINNKTVTIWKRNNVPAMSLTEDYSKNYEDVTNNIYISSIQSWSEISNWYSDLVKKQLKPDKILKSAFTEIFPNGYKNINEEERAKKIYSYIEDNIKYSSLDFRQSGYVPQIPSKTITTKLGDCKDVSTLFVALSELAELKSNLVLVSTNDNSDNSLSLPSKEFNHCIVKTTLNNKDYFLELTDNYLPFKSLPVSLYKANALVISFDKSENQNSKLIKIPFDNSIKNEINTSSVVNISDTEIKILNDHIIKGSTKPYYNELFSSATTDDVRKEDLEGIFNSRLKKTITMPSNRLIRNETYGDEIEFETQLLLNERIKNVGNLKIIEIPFVDKIYTRDIITKESRNYDINYINYENILNYNSVVQLNIPEGKKFTEIPENKTFAFKNHNFKITFELLKPNSLKVTRIVNTAWDNITINDYPQFKKYVENVLEVEEQVVGFK